MELVIQHMPNADNPTVVFGFSDNDFSQCVYLRVPMDPLESVKMADGIYKQFLDACAAAVSAMKVKKPR